MRFVFSGLPAYLHFIATHIVSDSLCHRITYRQHEESNTSKNLPSLGRLARPGLNQNDNSVASGDSGINGARPARTSCAVIDQCAETAATSLLTHNRSSLRPLKPPSNTRLTGALPCTSLLWEVFDRECVGGCRRASARASGINFQACSIDHSDISPFRIKDLQAVCLSHIIAKGLFKSSRSPMRFEVQRFTDGAHQIVADTV